jgi:hypothetical protein
MEDGMAIRRAVKAVVCFVSERLTRLAQWFRKVLSDPPRENSEARRRDDEDTVFQPRDF